uniref:Uncharacterized protein n=1 Tax=Timema poppense TaxID=170557 RepID=A0A7R9GZH3_TIMPO|nr:unnamed protein product [Timema poppensis]
MVNRVKCAGESLVLDEILQSDSIVGPGHGDPNGLKIQHWTMERKMARSRKDSTGSNVVDSYRKQIAKHDTKKSKESLKDTKERALNKENAPAIYKWPSPLRPVVGEESVNHIAKQEKCKASMLNFTVDEINNIKFLKHPLSVSVNQSIWNGFKLSLVRTNEELIEISSNSSLCFAHTLQNAISDSKRETPGVITLLSKCKAIVGHYQRSSSAKQRLHNIKKQFNLKQLESAGSSLHQLIRFGACGTLMSLSLFNVEHGVIIHLESKKWFIVFQSVRTDLNSLNIFHRGDVFRLFFPLFIAGLLLLPDYIDGVEGAPNCDVIVCCYVVLIRAVWG